MTTPVQTRSPVESLRPTMSASALSASLATGLMMFGAGRAQAQDMAPATTDTPIRLGPVRVGADDDDAEPDTNALRRGTQLDRLPDDLQSTPQTITVIPQVVIQQQQATTVEQVLKYVPGVTVSTGEGNGGINGDQFRIRGFDAAGDIYVDGLRDFGSYIRDSFATENVQVFKGPASQSFGNGTTGGAINIQSKTAHLGNSASVEASGGSASYLRGVVDVNRQVDATTAIRVVGMVHDQNVVERDHVYSKRWGVLASAGFGLGTDQTVIASYFHQRSTARPDFGVPTGAFGGAISEPLTEYGLPRANFYGRQSDRDAMNADVGTVRYKGRFGDWLTLANDTRVGLYTRDLRFTPSFCLDFPDYLAAIYGVPASTCASTVAAGNLDTTYTRWPVGGFKLKSYGGENVTTAVMRFATFGLRHELIMGVDAYYQHQRADFYAPSDSTVTGTLLAPIFQNPAGFSLNLDTNGITAHSWDVGPFISDRLWLTSGLSLLGGVRWDHYEVHGDNAGARIAATTEFASPKASVIWEPTPHQSYYASYGRSFTPPGSNITTLGSSLSLGGGATLNDLKPEIASTYEVGGKWSFLADRIGATAALFRVDKNNSTYTDPTSGLQSASGDKVRVQGVELGLTGKVMPAWDVQASYSYMDSRIVTSAISGFNPVSSDGNRVPYVSRHSAALWTTYDLASLVRRIPGQLLIGGGVNYRSDYYLDDAMTLRIPAATTLDAMLSYDIARYHLALNVTNLTDKLTYSSAFSNGYATPVAGRTLIVTAGVKF